MPERSFRYQPRSREELRERANMKGGDFDTLFKPKFKPYKIRDGKNIIRILPPTWEGARHYGYDLWINYNVGADNQSYLSLSKMKGEKDPLEEAKRQAERDGDKELANQLKPRQRILMWVIDRQNEDEGPLLFSCPFTLDKAIANIASDEDSKSIINVDDPEEGVDIKFVKEGSGLKTDYPAERIKLLEKSPLCDDEGVQEDWLAFAVANPLPTTLVFHDYNHINETFNGVVGSRDSAPKRTRDRDDDPPFDRGTRRSRSRDDEDEEKGEAPRQTRNRSSDQDDEEREKPTTRTRSRIDTADDDREDKVESGNKGRSEERPSLRDRLRSRSREKAEEGED